MPGVDYQINYIQGVITLARPSFGSTGDGLFWATGTDRDDVVFVAQYEYTPVAGDVDGYATGARVEGWVTRQLRVVVGGRRDLSTDVSIFGENTYDMFGQRDSLTSAYRVTCRANEQLTYTIAMELAQVQNGVTMTLTVAPYLSAHAMPATI